MTKISVIVPVYNMEAYLEQCVDSILNSTFQEIECILVDDGSSDKSVALCDAYAQKDARVKVLHKENGGLTSARKAGFDVATGEYVCFVDSDDYIAEDMLEKLLLLMEKESADVGVCSFCKDIDGKIVKDTVFFHEKVIEKEDIFEKYTLPTVGKIFIEGYVNYPGYVWGKLYRKSCVNEACFVSEREVYTEDDVFQMYLSENIKKVVFTNDKLCYYRMNTNSLSHVYRNDMWDMLKRRHELVAEYIEKKSNCENKKDVNDRILGSAYFAVFVSITKALSLQNYSEFRKVVKSIRKDPFSDVWLKKMDLSLIRRRQKIFYLMFQLRWYFGIYHFKDIIFR